MPRVMLTAMFRLQRFIPSSSLNREGLDYIYIYILAEIVRAQAVSITCCAGTGKGMKHPPFSGLPSSHPDCFPLPPLTAGLGSAAPRFPFCRGRGGLMERLVFLVMNSCFLYFSEVYSFLHCSSQRVETAAPASLTLLGSCVVELWGCTAQCRSASKGKIHFCPCSVSRMLGAVRCLKLGSKGRCGSTLRGYYERIQKSCSRHH